MADFFLIVLSFLAGFFSAIPAGGVQVEVIKRSLHDRLRTAAMVVGGSFLADAFFGVVALFGIAPLLRHRTVVAVFELVCAAILLALAWLTMRNSHRTQIDEVQRFAMASKRMSFLTGFSLGVTNPSMIFWWLVVRKVVSDAGLFDPESHRDAVMFVSCGALGFATYLLTLAVIIRRTRHLISTKATQRLSFVLGLLLLGLAGYCVFSSLRALLHGT